MATPKKKPAVRPAAAGKSKAAAAKKTAKKKTGVAAKKSSVAAGKKIAGKKSAGKKVAVKKKASPKGVAKKSNKKPVAKKAVTKKAVVKKGGAKKAPGKRVVSKKTTKEKPSGKNVRAKKTAASKPVARLQGLPPLMRPSGQGETVIVVNVTVTGGNEVVLEMELVHTERLVSNVNVFDLHTQRDDKGQVIIDVYHVRKDGLIGLNDHRRIIYLGEGIGDLQHNSQYLQEYAALKLLLEDLTLDK